MTGETHSGRSISEMSSERPRNLKRVTAQAANRPNIAFNGTAMAAVMRVSFTA